MTRRTSPSWIAFLSGVIGLIVGYSTVALTTQTAVARGGACPSKYSACHDGNCASTETCTTDTCESDHCPGCYRHA